MVNNRLLFILYVQNKVLKTLMKLRFWTIQLYVLCTDMVLIIYNITTSDIFDCIFYSSWSYASFNNYIFYVDCIYDILTLRMYIVMNDPVPFVYISVRYTYYLRKLFIFDEISIRVIKLFKTKSLCFFFNVIPISIDQYRETYVAAIIWCNVSF